MDTYWKKRLNENFVGSRIDGAFDRADREALQNSYEIDDRRLEPAEKLSRVMEADIAQKQRDRDIAQIKDYFYEFYGYDGFRNDGIMEEIENFGKKSRKHRQARSVLESALGLNQFRSETEHGGALVSAVGGGADLAHNIVLHNNANESSLKLAREFLGLKQEPVRGSSGQFPDESRLESRLPEAPRSKPQTVVPRPKPKIKNDLENSDAGGILNPFNLRSPDLRQQARILELNPMRARQLIKAAGRDPGLFGL